MIRDRAEGIYVLGRSGGDRRSRVLRHSTMGAGAVNGRVRDGIGFETPRSDHQTGQARRVRASIVGTGCSRRLARVSSSCVWLCGFDPDTDHESDQADRAISTGQLSALPRVHIQPIHVVVFHGSRGSSRFKGGFPLRCLQRLSRPDIATLHCGWRHNRSTRGPSIPVLSY